MKRVALGALLAFAFSVAQGQVQKNFPAKPIRIVATLSAGSQVDILTRIVAEKLQASLGQPVIVENMLGAGGSIAAARVAAATPDGHTLLATANGHAINPSLYDKLPFDTRKSFAGVAMLASVPSVIVANINGPKSIAEAIALAKQRPGTLTYASGGVGSASHLAGELFKRDAGIDIVHVPYKGTTEAIADLVGGRVDFSIAPVGAANVLIKDGKARALAVTSVARSPLLPNVPTMDESGVNGYRFDFWYALFAPAGVPEHALARLAYEVEKALAANDVREKFAAQSAAIPTLARARLDQFVAEEITRYAVLAKTSGAKGPP